MLTRQEEGKKLKMQMPYNVMKIGILRFGEILGEKNRKTQVVRIFKFFARGSRAIMVLSLTQTKF